MKYGVVCSIGLAAALALAATACACGHGPGSPQEGRSDASSGHAGAPGEYIVTVADGADGTVIADLYGRFGIKGTKDLGNGLYLVTLAEDPGLAAMEEVRGQNPAVKAVQPNFLYRMQKPLKTK